MHGHSCKENDGTLAPKWCFFDADDPIKVKHAMEAEMQGAEGAWWMEAVVARW